MNSPLVTSSGPTQRVHAARAARIITDAVEHVFASVELIRDRAIAEHRAALTRGEQMSDRDMRPIRDQVLALLAREREIIFGMGMIVSPGLLDGQRLQLEWWQRDPDDEAAKWLDVDLNPDSVDFYDYVAAEWFVVPRRTGRRHVMGPYVDVHGTDRYLLTLTMPVIDDGEFLGVAGADVPVAWFEAHVLGQLPPTDCDVVVVNAEDRVVLSSSPRWLTGSRVSPGQSGMPQAAAVLDDPAPPWRLAIV